MKKAVLILVSVMIFQMYITAYAEPVERVRSFDEVFTEAIGTAVDDIGYGMICFPSEEGNRAAELLPEDLEQLMSIYSRAEGECVIAPDGNYFNDYMSEAAAGGDHFYIGVSRELPPERWTWHDNVRMLQLCFGGEYGGAAVYGGYGIVKSSYGEEYPPAMPVNFVWYKPTGTAADELRELGNEIGEKYRDKAKPFGDYDGTGDERYFSGYDGTWDTKLTLPACFTAEGCSEWAYDMLQSAASDGLIPYNTSCSYKEPITRGEFCDLTANLLNMTPYREYDDLFANPSGYTVLAEKAATVGADPESISYSDVPQMPESIKYLSALKIVGGVGNNEFDPDGYITREQICAILSRIFAIYPEFKDALSDKIDNEEPARYDDSDSISAWAYGSVYYMTRCEIINGVGDNCFEPKGLCTLEQAITIISRLPHVFGIKQ